jgi:hypothetical protein
VLTTKTNKQANNNKKNPTFNVGKKMFGFLFPKTTPPPPKISN